MKSKSQLVVTIISGVVLLGVVVAVLLRGNSVFLWSQSNPEEDAGQNTVAQVDPPADDPAKSDDAQNQSSEPEQQSDTKTEPTANKTETSDGYSYVAVAGDSYTKLARQAINKYAMDNNVKLSTADALTAEVQLANAAGSPELEVGDEVKLTASDIQKVLPTSTTVAAKDTKSEATKDDKQSDSNESSNSNYRYAAKSGDSYTVLARESVNKYATSNKLELSHEQRIAAETFLTVAAGSPELEVDQKVEMPEADVRSAVDKAKKLNQQELSSWTVYISVVKFN